MIPVPRPPEPPGFDAACRRRGAKWLDEHPAAKRLPAYWLPFRAHLADGFANLCGYSALYEPVGSVDHFLSSKKQRGLAYEWDNYRFAAEWINKSKQNADDDVLDPFEVGEDWFEIVLPSLQLRVTDRVPARHRARAEYTLTRLRLDHDERVLRQRRAWYALYRSGRLTFEGLAIVAPLIAAAVRRGNADE